MRFSGPAICEKVVLLNQPKKFIGLIPYKGTVDFWRLREPLRFYFDDKRPEYFVYVEAPMDSDLASVPWLFRGLIPKDGPYTRSSFIHDDLYHDRGHNIYYELPDGSIKQSTLPITRKEQDRIFRDCMKIDGVPALTRFAMWRAVRHGGWISYPREPKK